jgi:hypothetical protein
MPQLICHSLCVAWKRQRPYLRDAGRGPGNSFRMTLSGTSPALNTLVEFIGILGLHVAQMNRASKFLQECILHEKQTTNNQLTLTKST